MNAIENPTKIRRPITRHEKTHENLINMRFLGLTIYRTEVTRITL